MKSAAKSGSSAAAGAMALCDLVTSSGVTALAVVGLAKNAGKTTVINTLLEGCPGMLGLTSLGLDGEVEDHLTGLAKPRIVPPRGTLVATTRGSLHRSQHQADALEELPFRTALGTVEVVRTGTPGRVEVSGPTTLAELRMTVDRLKALGAHLVLVDGAIDRLGSASPRVTEALILATGAAACDDPDEVVERTADVLSMLLLPEADTADRHHYAHFVDAGVQVAAFDSAGRQLSLDHSTGVGAGPELAREAKRLGAKTLLLGGALTESLLEGLMRGAGSFRPSIVIRDATAVIAPPSLLRRCCRRLDIRVLTALRILAVTTNPFRLPRPLAPEAFFTMILEAVNGRVPVFDVMTSLIAPPSPATSGSPQGGQTK